MEKLKIELPAFEEVKTQNQIPRSVYRAIKRWKANNTIVTRPRSNFEKHMFKFELANKGEAFNAGCIIELSLPQRQLISASRFGSKWLIIYNHGRGGAGVEMKMLYIDVEFPKQITLIRISRSKIDQKTLISYLNELNNQSKSDKINHVYLLESKCYQELSRCSDIAFKI